MEKKEELLAALKKKGKISDEEIADLKQETVVSGKTFEEAIAEKKKIDPEDLAKAKAGVFNLPYQSLAGFSVNSASLNTIPFDAADNYKVICFERGGNQMKVGIVDPENLKAFEAVDFLANKLGLAVEYYLVSEPDFKAAIRQYKTLKGEVSSALEGRVEEEKKKNREKKEFQEIYKSAPIAKIVSVIMRHAVEGRASDIHIEPLPKETRVRYRIDGILYTSLVLPKEIHNAVVARIKVMANLKLDETRIPQDGRIRDSVNGKEIDFRISILPLVETEKVVMRILDVTKGAPMLEQLGFMGGALEVIKKSIRSTEGILLITGPTGSGKSTTLFSVLNMLNEEGVNISTLEDPVEYFVKGANQSQVRPEVNFTFASGLRALLRQDPDIIMVGEIRDGETAELAVHAGLTGHFVLSTLHTNDAIGALPRLIDMKVEPFLLVSTLKVVVAQRLARKICENCKTKADIPENVLKKVKDKIAGLKPETRQSLLADVDLENPVFYRGKGCARCGNSGYSGRIAITEVLDVNDKIKEAIIDRNKVLTIDEVKKNQEFVTIDEDGVIKALNGLTTIEEVLRVIQR